MAKKEEEMFTDKNIKALAVCLTALMVFCLYGPDSYSREKDISDRDITHQVNNELLFDPGVSSHLVDVKTDAGIVTMTGTVDNILAKERSAEIAKRVKGVKSVVNRIKVKPVKEADEQVRQNALEALSFNPATERYEIKVAVEDGTVTLSGTVNSWAEKQLAGKVVKRVKGVRELDNAVSVRYRSDRSDDEILREIREKMEWDIYVDETWIEVAVNDG
ncbi:MAG: BON domain-containing protein, partial [Candidatus Omnitrophica bacterium]|nr:BON domain-containing protein [Candidatus Omnitrophota bacterium]